MYNNGSEFNMYGGVISGNNSEDCGGGVFAIMVAVLICSR